MFLGGSATFGPLVLGEPLHPAARRKTVSKKYKRIDLHAAEAITSLVPGDQQGEDKSENTLNGIAYDEAGDRIFVTGKKWKNLYEIKLKPKQ